jgi:hypothetical protein
MKIAFHHPPTGTANPFKDFDPCNPSHYPDTKGIYINGLRLTMDGAKRFVPLYVGIAHKDSLKNRLFNHHYKKFKSCVNKDGTGNKDLWDLSSVVGKKDLQNLYDEMAHYDYINNYRGSKASRAKHNTSQTYLMELLFLKYLLFFQNRNYFQMKHGGGFFALDKHERELNHCDAINEGFDTEKKIARTKSIYTKDFYYVYCSYEEIKKQFDHNKKLLSYYPDCQSQLERIEMASKWALKTIGIHTTAKAEGEIVDMEIDLSKVQNELINMGRHPFNINEVYPQPLLIKITK